jgi:hypothetical protein
MTPEHRSSRVDAGDVTMTPDTEVASVTMPSFVLAEVGVPD